MDSEANTERTHTAGFAGCGWQ